MTVEELRTAEALEDDFNNVQEIIEMIDDLDEGSELLFRVFDKTNKIEKRLFLTETETGQLRTLLLNRKSAALDTFQNL